MKNEIIIIEGTDGVGKTTYAKYLAEQMGGEYKHTGPPTHDHPIDEYFVPLMIHKATAQHPLILDRWHMGEAIWPDIFRRPSLLGAEPEQQVIKFNRLNKAMRDLGGIRMVIISRSIGGIMDTLTERRESDLQVAQALAGREAYYKMAREIRHIPYEIIRSSELPTAPKEG